MGAVPGLHAGSIAKRVPHSSLPVPQAALSVPLRRATLGVWDALDLLGTLREYETALLEEDGLDPTLALHEHAAQTADACRAAFPDLDWLHLVGLLHSLGKLLAHKRCALPVQHGGSRLKHHARGMRWSSAKNESPILWDNRIDAVGASSARRVRAFRVVSSTTLAGAELCGGGAHFPHVASSRVLGVDTWALEVWQGAAGAMYGECVQWAACSSAGLRAVRFLSCHLLMLHAACAAQVRRGAAVVCVRGKLPSGLPLLARGGLRAVLQRQPRPPPPPVQHAHRHVPPRLRPGRRLHVLERR